MAIPGFLGAISGGGTLEVYKDSGIIGNIIYPNQENVHCLSGNCLIPFLLNCNVESENIYTLHFIPGTGIPDSFFMQQDYLNTYIGGKMYEFDPSETYRILWIWCLRHMLSRKLMD